MQQLDEDDYLRSKLFAGDRSAIRRYADLVVGADASYARLARYELVTTLAGRVSGALGLALRKVLTPRCSAGAARAWCSAATWSSATRT